MAEIQSVAVIGAGTMGNGLAQSCAMVGLTVGLVDTEERFLQRALDNVKTSLARFVRSQKLSQEQADASFARIHPSTALPDAVANADIVIEVVPELIELKQAVFRQLAKAAKPGTVLATNTSQLSITAIASAVDQAAHRAETSPDAGSASRAPLSPDQGDAGQRSTDDRGDREHVPAWQ